MKAKRTAKVSLDKRSRYSVDVAAEKKSKLYVYGNLNNMTISTYLIIIL